MLLNLKMSLREEKCVGDYKIYWQSKSKMGKNVDSHITKRFSSAESLLLVYRDHAVNFKSGI